MSLTVLSRTVLLTSLGFLCLLWAGDGGARTILPHAATTTPVVTLARDTSNRHRRLLARALAQGSLPFQTATQTPVDLFPEHLRQCVEHGDKNCVQASLRQAYDPKLNEDPDFLELKARAWSLLRRKTEALEAIQEAIGRAPDQYRMRMTQGRICQNFGDQVSAIRSFLLADRLQPHTADTFYSLGMSFFLLEEYERAKQHFQQTLGLDPRYDRAIFMLGIIDMVHFRLPEAKPELEKALAMNPKNAFYHLYYAILLNRLNDNASALKELKVAKQIDPSYALIRLNLGRLLKDQGEVGAAREELEAAVKLRPNLSAAYYLLGGVYHRLGMDKESQEAYKRFEVAKTEEIREAKDPVESALEKSASEPAANEKSQAPH